jgi:hypothetical protein
LTILIGILAALATWLCLVTHLGLYAWAVCLRWSSFYHSGGKNDGLKMSLISNVFGATVGTVGTVTLLIVGTVVGSLVDQVTDNFRIISHHNVRILQ